MFPLQDMRNARRGNIDCYSIDCRQMAYNHCNFDLVNLIDEINGKLWPFVKPRERVTRKKKPLAEKLREKLDFLDDQENSDREYTTRKHSGAAARTRTEVKIKKHVRVEAEPVILPKSKKTSIIEGKNPSEPAQTKQHLLIMPMLKTSREGLCRRSTLADLSEVNQSNPRAYRYKYTRDFLARQKDRERQRQEKLEEASNVGQSRRCSVANDWRHPSKMDRNSSSNQQNASPHSLRYIDGPDVSTARIQSPTRLLSPWREDDKMLLHNLKSRSGRSPYRTQKPALSRKQALLPLLPEHATPRNLHETVRTESRTSARLPVAKLPLRDTSPANEWVRQADLGTAAVASPCATPSPPTRCRSNRRRTAVTKSKDDKFPRAKTYIEPVAYRKTVKWDFDVDAVLRPTLVRFPAPPPGSLDELEDMFEYSVPMPASLV